MIAEAPLVLVVLFSGSAILFLLMLIPSFLELKKPKDDGPRMIMDDIAELTAQSMRFEINFISSLEEKDSSAKLKPTIAGVLGVLQNIDV